MPINKNVYIMYDTETGSRNPTTTQAIQIAAIAIDPRNLTIIPDSEFESLIRPELNELKQKELGIDNIEQGALDVNGKTLEMLADAPAEKTVWQSFTQYCMGYNTTGKKWDAPILTGFNNLGFDNIILNRMAKKYGPYESERDHCSLFHPIWKMDVMQLIFPLFESNYEVRSLSMDNLRDYFGMSKENAHDALQDVKDQAEIFCAIMKANRKLSKVITWKKPE